MTTTYETVISTTATKDIKIDATLTRGFFKAEITHTLRGVSGNPTLTYAELQAAPLKAVIQLAQEQLDLLQAAGKALGTEGP